jgi:hypothetical protein
MKKQTLIVALGAMLFLSLAGFHASAQQGEKGNLILNAGIGLGYYYAGGVSLNLNGEYYVTDQISVGGYFAYTRWDYDYGFSQYDYSYNFIDIGARGSYHFAKLFKVNNKKFDPYAGAFLGFVSSSYSYDGPGGASYNDPYDGGVRTGIFAGARYYFSNNFAGYGELGVGLSPIVLGVTFKL